METVNSSARALRHAALATALLLVACADPFEIASTTPPPDVTGVAINAKVQVTFTAEADPATLTASTFSVEGVQGTVSYDPASKTVSFTPASPLEKLTRYTATITTAVKDGAGNALPQGRTWSFTTGPVLTTREMHSLVLKSDGSVWGWGRNFYGQLGDGSTTDRKAPVRVTALSGDTIASLATGAGFSLALTDKGTVLGWGANWAGELGRGDHTNQELAAAPVSGLSGVKAIAAGRFFALALKRDGTVWGWGDNGSGQLGDGTTEGRYSPVQARGLSDVVAISAGADHAIALKADGTVWTWGNNAYGQIGNGDFGLSPTDSSDKKALEPWKVTGLSGMTAISAGYRYNLALKSDGTVWMWGGNNNDIMARSDEPIFPSPVQRAGLAGIRSIAAGYWHALAMKDDGSVWGWGSRYYSELGDGRSDITDPSAAVPLQTVGLGTVATLVAGEATSLALETDGTVRSWGDNENGKLGLGDAGIVNTATAVGTF